MTRTLQTLLLAAVLIGTPTAGFALSAVFNGDPVNPATGLP